MSRKKLTAKIILTLTIEPPDNESWHYDSEAIKEVLNKKSSYAIDSMKYELESDAWDELENAKTNWNTEIAITETEDVK